MHIIPALWRGAITAYQVYTWYLVDDLVIRLSMVRKRRASAKYHRKGDVSVVINTISAEDSVRIIAVVIPEVSGRPVTAKRV